MPRAASGTRAGATGPGGAMPDQRRWRARRAHDPQREHERERAGEHPDEPAQDRVAAPPRARERRRPCAPATGRISASTSRRIGPQRHELAARRPGTRSAPARIGPRVQRVERLQHVRPSEARERSSRSPARSRQAALPDSERSTAGIAGGSERPLLGERQREREMRELRREVGASRREPGLRRGARRRPCCAAAAAPASGLSDHGTTSGSVVRVPARSPSTITASTGPPQRARRAASRRPRRRSRWSRRGRPCGAGVSPASARARSSMAAVPDRSAAAVPPAAIAVRDDDDRGCSTRPVARRSRSRPSACRGRAGGDGLCCERSNP